MTSSDWYTWQPDKPITSPAGEGTFGRSGRLQGDIEADSGALYQLSVKGYLVVGDDPNQAGMAAGSLSTDTLLWAGSNYANRATAPFRVTADGNVFFEVSGTVRAAATFKNSSVTPYSQLNGQASSTSTFTSIYALYTANKNAYAQAYADTTLQQAALVGADIGGSKSAQVAAQVNGGVSQINFQIDGVHTLDASITNRSISLYGRLYPGTGSSSQTTGYLDWNATLSTIRVPGDFEIDGFPWLPLGVTGSGALPNPTKWVWFKSGGGTVFYIPAFTSPNPWTA